MKNKLALICLLLAMMGLTACGGSVSAEKTEPAGESVYIHAVKMTAEASWEPLTQAPPATAADPATEPATENPPETEKSSESAATREVLPLGLVKESGKWYYYAQPGVKFRGWLQTAEGYSYFNPARVEGLVTIDGDTYYFPKGIMATGMQTVRGVKMEFDKISGKLIQRETESAAAAERHGVVDGYLYDRGTLLKGYVNLDGQWYLADEEGRILTGKQQVEGKWLYFRPEGPQAFGFVEGPGGLCYYAGEEGVLQSGFVLVSGVLRYFDPDSLAMVRNTSVGGYSVDGSGRCSKQTVEVTDANLDAYVDSILAEIGPSPRAIYDYVRQNYVYVVMGWDTERNMAIQMFNSGYGACIHFCAVTEMLLNRAGYRCHWVRGEQGHYWLLVEMSPGVWRHMDTMRKNYNVYNLTDAELWVKHDGPYGIATGVNFHWDRSKWTSTSPTGLGDGVNVPPLEGEESPAESTEAQADSSEATKESPEATTESTAAAETTSAPTEAAETTEASTTAAPETEAPTEAAETTEAPATAAPETTPAPTEAPTEAPTAAPPETGEPPAETTPGQSGEASNP